MRSKLNLKGRKLNLMKLQNGIYIKKLTKKLTIVAVPNSSFKHLTYKKAISLRSQEKMQVKLVLTVKMKLNMVKVHICILMGKI